MISENGEDFGKSGRDRGEGIIWMTEKVLRIRYPWSHLWYGSLGIFPYSVGCYTCGICL